MGKFAKKNEVEAIKFDGKNIADIKTLLEKLGKEWVITEMKDPTKKTGVKYMIGKWMLDPGCYLVKDNNQCFTMDADAFEMLYKPGL